MLIEIVEGVWLDPWSVTYIKRIEDGKCALWTTGQSALEGFVLDYDAGEVAEAVNDAREDDGSGEENIEDNEE
jgi:hypothetical protein